MSCIKNNSIINSIMFMPPAIAAYEDNDNVFYLQLTKEINTSCMLYLADKNRLYNKFTDNEISNMPIIVFCHGNATDIGRSKGFCQMLMSYTKCHVLLLEYPGYGLTINQFKPCEQYCELAIAGVIDYLLNIVGVPTKNIILFGQSIGTGIAAYGAKYCYETYNEHIGGLILLSPYLSIKKLASKITPSSSSLILDRFVTEENIKYCNAPILIIHGEKDEVIPVHHSRELCKIISDCSKHLLLTKFPKTATHNIFNTVHDIMLPCNDLIMHIKQNCVSNNIPFKMNDTQLEPTSVLKQNKNVGLFDSLSTSVATSAEVSYATTNIATTSWFDSCHLL
jgi:pimeloyl-ACP methyl ester carboxylesterase